MSRASHQPSAATSALCRTYLPTREPQPKRQTDLLHMASAKGKQRAQRRSRSRNASPLSTSSVSATVEASHGPYLQTPLSSATILSNTPVHDFFEGSSSSSNPPSASTLRNVLESVKSQLLNTIKPREETCDRLMRELSSKKKERLERVRQRERDQQEIAEREAEERKVKPKPVTVTVTPSKREREDEQPLAIGAHRIARQDGVSDVHTGKSK
jgi:transcriptional adapter 3